MRNTEIKDNLYDLYSVYQQYKALFNYYQQNKSMKTRDEISNRVEYIKKNKIKQKSELETLLWVLGLDGDINVDD